MSTGKRRHVLCEFSLSILMSCLCLVSFLTQSYFCLLFREPLTELYLSRGLALE